MKNYYRRLKLGSVAAAALLCTSLTAETFTTCGATGPYGPDQAACDTAYTGTDLEGVVTVTDGIQEWTVLETGEYTIEAFGAQGGTNNSQTGGLGARMKGTFSLTAGDEIMILVGQQGLHHYSTDNRDETGGGGGSFVVKAPYDSNESILVIAGGGGGVSGPVNDVVTRHATIETFGQDGDQTQYSNTPGYGGTDGNGGYQGGAHAGNGGGFFTDGEDGSYPGGAAFVNGGNGGDSTSADGGFGGGASGGNSGGGGGGGYSGGGGSYHYPTAGGGAGSYNSGLDQNNSSAANQGDGMVIITRLEDSTPGGGTNGTGGGCTYNPNNRGIDLMLILMMAMALFYPVRRRFIK